MKILSVFLIFLVTISLSQDLVFAQWIQQITGTTEVFISIDSPGAQDVFAVGANGLVLKTTNSGDNWVNINSTVSNNLISVKFRNTSTGYTGGDGGALLRTNNSGNNWTILNFGGSETVNGIDLYPTTVIFIATNEGRVYRSDNSGDNFAMLADLTAGSLNTIESLGPGLIVTGGDAGAVFKSTNNGVNWINISLPVSHNVKDVGFFDALTGYCLTVTSVFKTTNGGANWAELVVFPPGELSMYYNRFSGTDTVYVTGVSGRIFKTVNSGSNWFQQSSGTGSVLFGITGQSNGNLWICGSAGKILRTTNGGGNFVLSANQISGETPREFSLSQNFPNPFNPSTNIKFSVMQTGFVQIKVYDLLGKERANVVNQELPAGTYKTEFDASALPSGTYFYRLTAGGYTETKKMILIK